MMNRDLQFIVYLGGGLAMTLRRGVARVAAAVAASAVPVSCLALPASGAHQPGIAPHTSHTSHISQTPYTPYAPYAPYAPRTPHALHTPHASYVLHAPHTPYAPYLPHVPYGLYTTYVPHVPYAPHRSDAPHVPYVPYMPYVPHRTYRPYTSHVFRAPHAASPVSCSSSRQPALAAKLAADIQAARSGRVSSVAVGVDDPGAGLVCWFNPSAPFDSASVVKVTILAALLRTATAQHRYLTQREASLATAMITRSDNNATSALWAELGPGALRNFLSLARMTQTSLGQGGYWGLTQITAHDEILLLRLLASPNPVLGNTSRSYALGLMARVVPAQRWGVPAGAPVSLTTHVKNGWLPRSTHGWRIHSIGCFTGPGRTYSIVVLTQDNPTMAYGVSSVEAIARVIHRDLNPGATSAPPAAPARAADTPDEDIPPQPGIP